MEDEGEGGAEAEGWGGLDALERGGGLRMVIVGGGGYVVVRLGGLQYVRVGVSFVAEALAHRLGVEQLLELSDDDAVAFESFGDAVARGDVDALCAYVDGVAGDYGFGGAYFAAVFAVDCLVEFGACRVLRRHGPFVCRAVIFFCGFASRDDECRGCYQG